jgi:hypothetical protein
MEEKRGEDAGSTNTINNKLILKKAVYKKMDHLMGKAFISEREVYDLVRSFFKKHLTIDYEFTREELMKELKKIYLSPDLQDKVQNLLSDISQIEHMSKDFTKEELAEILNDFRDVVDGLIVSHYQQERSFFKRFKDSLHKIFSSQHKKILEAEEVVLVEDERSIVKMNMLLDDAKRALDVNLEKAKELYKELINIYNALPMHKKKAYYTPVQDLYTMIKNRDNKPVKQ